jgi:hypothetical protein
LKPSLFCRTFTNLATQQKVVGFRAVLTGTDANALASRLSQQLRSYQQQGGSLSRCVYSGYLSPSLTASRLNGQLPTALIRKADSYRMPIYGSYQQFLSANGGRAARFGLIASQPSLRTQSGRQIVTRITVNNALVLFIDARNQQSFKLEPAGVSLRLLPLSQGVQQVLADAAKPSLQKLIDFRRLKKVNSGSSSSSRLRLFDGFLMGRQGPGVAVAALPAASSLFTLPSSPALAESRRMDPVADRLLSSFAASSAAAVQIAQVVPSAYCRVQSSFYPQSFCVELESGSVQDLVQCETAFIGRDREVTLCRLLFDEVSKIQGGSRSPSTDSSSGSGQDSGSDLSNPDGSSANGEGPALDEFADPGLDGGFDEAGFDEDGSGDVGVSEDDGSSGMAGLDSYEDPDQMIPEDMSPPVSAACNASNFGEQFVCLLMQALSGMLQQAFSK